MFNIFFFFQNYLLNKVALDYNSEYPKGYLECYCKKDPIHRYYENFLLADSFLCQTWTLQKFIITFLSFMAAFIIVIINLTIKTMFTSAKMLNFLINN